MFLSVYFTFLSYFRVFLFDVLMFSRHSLPVFMSSRDLVRPIRSRLYTWIPLPRPVPPISMFCVKLLNIVS